MGVSEEMTDDYWRTVYVSQFGEPKHTGENWKTDYEIRRTVESQLVQVELRYVPDVKRPYDNIPVGIFTTTDDDRIWGIAAAIVNENVKKHENLLSVCSALVQLYSATQQKVQYPISAEQMKIICTCPGMPSRLVIVTTSIFS